MHQAHGAQGDGAGAGQGRNAQHIVARAAQQGQGGGAVGRVEQDRVAAIAGVHADLATTQNHGVGTGAGGHHIIAQTHVQHHGAGGAGEAVIAAGAGVQAAPAERAAGGPVVAEVEHAIGQAAGELIIAGTARNDGALVLPADHALGAATLDQEAVVALAAVEIEHRVHTLADVDRIVAAAAAGPDGLDIAAPVVLVLTERAHDVHVGLRVILDAGALVDDLVVIGRAVAAGGIAHIEHQGVALQARDTRGIGPGPEVAAGDRDAHHRHPRSQVAAGRCDVDLAAEARQGEVDVDEAQVQLKIQ